MSEITPERIAELRKQYPMVWSRNRDHHPFGHFAYSTLDINELLDALEFSRAEVDKTLGRLTDAKAQLAGAEAEARMFGQESTRLRAEVQRLQRERDAAIDERNAWRSGDQDSRIEADRLRGEVQRLTEEARRSDAGRVEVPELTDPEAMDICKRWGKPTLFSDRNMVREAYNLARSRLSPSPQPATGAVIRGVTHMGILPKDSRPGDLYWERGAWREWKADGPMANASSFAWIRPFPSPQPSADVVVVPRGSLESVVINIQRTPKIGDAYDSLVDALRSSLQPSAGVVVVPREECPECGSTLLDWGISHTTNSSAPDGRLRMNEIQTVAHLGCQTCSETVRTLDERGILDVLRSSTNHDSKEI